MNADQVKGVRFSRGEEGTGGSGVRRGPTFPSFFRQFELEIAVYKFDYNKEQTKVCVIHVLPS